MNKLLSLIFLYFLVLCNVFAGPFDIKNIPLKIQLLPVLHPILIWQPDLVVTDIHTIGTVTVRADGFQEVPVRVVVENQGDGIASNFMLSARYITSQGDFMRPFTVAGQTSQWKPTTMASLHPKKIS